MGRIPTPPFDHSQPLYRKTGVLPVIYALKLRIGYLTSHITAWRGGFPARARCAAKGGNIQSEGMDVVSVSPFELSGAALVSGQKQGRNTLQAIFVLPVIFHVVIRIALADPAHGPPLANGY